MANVNLYRQATKPVKSRKAKSQTSGIQKTPEQKKQEKLTKLKQDIAELRRKKAELRSERQKYAMDQRVQEFQRKLDALDNKINDKLARMREVTTGIVQKVGHAAKETALAPKRVWDNWKA